MGDSDDSIDDLMNAILTGKKESGTSTPTPQPAAAAEPVAAPPAAVNDDQQQDQLLAKIMADVPDASPIQPTNGNGAGGLEEEPGSPTVDDMLNNILHSDRKPAAEDKSEADEREKAAAAAAEEKARHEAAEAAREVAARLAAEEAAKLEAEREAAAKAAAEKARQDADAVAAAAAATAAAEAEKAAAAKAEADRKAQEAEAQRQQQEAAAAKQEADRVAAEKEAAAKKQAQRVAAEKEAAAKRQQEDEAAAKAAEAEKREREEAEAQAQAAQLAANQTDSVDEEALLQQILNSSPKKAQPSSGEAVASPVGSPADLNRSETSYADEMLNNILTAEKKAANGAATAAATEASDGSTPASAPVATAGALTSDDSLNITITPSKPGTSGLGNAVIKKNPMASELSLEEEEQVLQAILGAIDKNAGAGSDDVDQDELAAVLAHAERLAGSTIDTQPGTSVLTTHEASALKDELKSSRTTTGKPLCIDVCPVDDKTSEQQLQLPSMAVGTSLGPVLLFNSKNKLCGVCGAVSMSAESRGSCISVSFSSDGETVLAGYERGAVVLWEVSTLQAAKTITGEFESPVCLTSFMRPDPMKCFALDGDGVLRIFSFAKVMGKFVFRTNTVDLDFDIPCNDAVSMCESVTNPDTNEMKDIHYLACVCSDRLKVFSIDFGIQNNITLVYDHRRRPTSAKSNELVLWLDRQRPTLCVCWTTEVEIFNLIATPEGTSMAKTNVIQLPKPIHTLASLDGDCIMLLDQDDAVHVADTAKGNVAESLHLKNLHPVVFSSRSCGMKFGGSTCSAQGTAHILGDTRVISCTVLSWESRLDTLITLKMWDEAFELAAQFSNDEAVATVGLPEGARARREVLQAFVTQMIIGFCTAKMRGDPSQDEVRATMNRIIDFTAKIHALDITYGPVLTFFNNVKKLDMVLYCFEDALVNGTVSAIPEHVISMFLELFNDPTRFAKVDSDPGSDSTAMERAELALMFVDENPEVLLAVASQYKLKRLSCVVLSLRMAKPEAPIALCLGGNSDIALEYISGIVHGESLIPGVMIPSSTRRTFKQTVLRFLIDDAHALEELLKFNVSEMLKILDNALTDTSDSNPWKGTVVDKLSVYTRLEKILVDPAVPYNRPWDVEKKSFPPYTSVAMFFDIMASHVANEDVELSGETMSDFAHRLTWHVVYRCSRVTSGQDRITLQRPLCDLFASKVMSRVNTTKIEKELRTKHLARALAAIHTAQGNHAHAIACYLDDENATMDPELATDVFAYITTAMNDAKESHEGESIKRSIRDAVKQYIGSLVNVDATALAQFVFEYLPEDHGDVLHSLEGTSRTFFLYLKELILNGGEKVHGDDRMQTMFIEVSCIHEPDEVYGYLVKWDSTITYDLNAALRVCQEARIIDAQIFLLEKTLQIKEALSVLMTSITSNLEQYRENVCKRATTSALDETLRDISQFSFGDLSFVTNSVSTKGSGQTTFRFDPVDESDAQVLKMVNVGIELCTRYQSKLDVQEQSALWFSLLDRFAKPKRLLLDRQLRATELRLIRGQGNAIPDEECVDAIDDNELHLATALEHNKLTKIPIIQKPLSQKGTFFMIEMQEMYGKYTSFILSQMVKVLDLSIVVGKIVDDNEREKFGPFKPIIVDILASLSFDLEVNRLCRLCTESDTLNLGIELRKTLTRGLSPKSEFCRECGKHLTEQVSEFDTLRFYPCGCGYHESCCGTATECTYCSSEGLSKSHQKSAAGRTDAAKKDIAQRKEKEQKAVQRKDIKHIMRRLHHTRSKLDGGINYHEMLQQFLNSDDSRSLKSSINKRLALKGLLLSPQPPEPSTIGDLQVGALPAQADVTEAMAEDDIKDLFGEDGVYVAPPPKARRRAPTTGPGQSPGLHSNDEDIDLDELTADF